MSAKHEQELRDLLAATGLVQPVVSKSRTGSVEVLCRLLPGQEAAWLGVMKNLLMAFERVPSQAYAGSDLNVSRRYVLKEGNMVFGYHVGISAKSAKAIDTILSTLRETAAKIPAPQPMAPPPPAPRAPAPARAQQTRTPGPQLQQVRKGMTPDGKPVEEWVMPMPHTKSRELNKPTTPVLDPATGQYRGGGRGATASR